MGGGGGGGGVAFSGGKRTGGEKKLGGFRRRAWSDGVRGVAKKSKGLDLSRGSSITSDVLASPFLLTSGPTRVNRSKK